MSWFADLAGKAESLLNNLDEQTGAALRNHNVPKKKHDRNDHNGSLQSESTWGQRRRPVQRSLKKAAPIPDIKIPPTAKPSPMSAISNHHQSRLHTKEIPEKISRTRKSPARNGPNYNLNHCPKTLVGDVRDNDIIDHFVKKQRRHSLPTDLEIINNEDEGFAYKMQNLEVENAMLKNELNVMNRELAELLDRVRKSEDGNDVDSQELQTTHIQLESTELLNQKANLDKDSLMSQMEQLKSKLQELVTTEVTTVKERNKVLQDEVDMLRNRNKDLEDKCKELSDARSEKESAQIKLENDLRHAQSTIAGLNSNLAKSNEECRRLEKDWEAYKLRVKNMLHAKDSEIKSLQQGMELTEDTKELMDQIDLLKEERDELAEAVATVRSQFDDMRASMAQMEARHSGCERVLAALRDALREERAARNKSDAQAMALAKELKSQQMESNQTIVNLRTALRDKEEEINRLQDASNTTVRTTDTSALNVADYDVMQDTIENNKIQYLTQTLVQRQAKIDKLLAHNNILRIQLEKLETKLKSEIASIRASNPQSVVHLQDGGGGGSEYRHRSRTYVSGDTLSALSVRMGVMVKRYPIVRIFIIIYMVCLHFWVLTVLFTSTPEDYVTRPKA